MEEINNLDISLFQWINSDLKNSFFDVICPIWRDKNTWIPLYVILLIYSVYKYKTKVVYFLIGVVALILMSDTISSKVFKPFFERLRPCNFFDDEHINLLVNCSGGFSFTSSHATNHMALATFVSLTLLSFKWQKYSMYLWAIFVGFSQIYVGVHYPGDVIVGLILGLLIGVFVSHFVNKKSPLNNLIKNN